MAIVAGLDVHRAQITLDALDTTTGELMRGRIDATPAAVARWAARVAGRRIEVAVEACTGWLFVCDALAAAGVPHLAEPVETRALRGRKRRAKTDRENALEFPRFRGHLMAVPTGAAERMSGRAQDAAVSGGVPSRSGPVASPR